MLSGESGKVILKLGGRMNTRFKEHLQVQLQAIREAGLYKNERVISTPQDVKIRVAGGEPVLNLCANNYLGFAQHPAISASGSRGTG